MNRLLIFAIALSGGSMGKIAFAADHGSSETSSASTSEAEALVDRLGASNCSANGEGYLCMVKAGGKDVGIAIPKNYRPSGKCLVHFHGLRFGPGDGRDADATPKSTLAYFRFPTALNRSAPDTLMIAPVGARGKSNYDLDDSYGSLSKLDGLLDKIESLTGQNCGQLSLSGHSAAYKVLTPLLEEAAARPSRGRAASIKNVFLFDALYSSNVAPLQNWANGSGHRLFNVSRGGAPRENSLEIESDHYKNYRSEISDHWELVRDQYLSQFLSSAR